MSLELKYENIKQFKWRNMEEKIRIVETKRVKKKNPYIKNPYIKHE